MTTTTTTIDERIERFVSAVAGHFTDLPVSERDELLGDLEQHLRELAEDDHEAFEVELADPERYAADLRETAGLAPQGAAPPTGRVSGLTEGLRDGLRSLLELQVLAPIRQVWPMLRPAWWILRAWGVVVLAGVLISKFGVLESLIIPGRDPVGLVLLVVAVLWSVRAGLDGTDRGRWGTRFDRLAAGAVVVVALMALTAPTHRVEYVYDEGLVADAPVWQLLTHPDGEGITNLFVYDADGELLRDVFVYDGAGRPVEVGTGVDEFFDLRTDRRVDADGRVVGNLYPLTQYVRDADGGLVLRDLPEVDVPPMRSVEPEPAPATSEPGGVTDQDPAQPSEHAGDPATSEGSAETGDTERPGPAEADGTGGTR